MDELAVSSAAAGATGAAAASTAKVSGCERDANPSIRFESEPCILSTRVWSVPVSAVGWSGFHLGGGAAASNKCATPSD